MIPKKEKGSAYVKKAVPLPPVAENRHLSSRSTKRVGERQTTNKEKKSVPNNFDTPSFCYWPYVTQWVAVLADGVDGRGVDDRVNGVRVDLDELLLCRPIFPRSLSCSKVSQQMAVPCASPSPPDAR